MRMRDRLISAASLAAALGLAPGFAFEGTIRPSADADPGKAPSISRAAQPEVPRPPGMIPCSGALAPSSVAPAAMPNALKDGHKQKALISLEFAANQGVVGAQWKLARMYAEGDGVDQSDLRAFEVFQPHC